MSNLSTALSVWEGYKWWEVTVPCRAGRIFALFMVVVRCSFPLIVVPSSHCVDVWWVHFWGWVAHSLFPLLVGASVGFQFMVRYYYKYLLFEKRNQKTPVTSLKHQCLRVKVVYWFWSFFPFAFWDWYSPDILSFLHSVPLVSFVCPPPPALLLLYCPCFSGAAKSARKSKRSSLPSPVLSPPVMPLRKTNLRLVKQTMDASRSEKQPANEPWHHVLVEKEPSALCFLPLAARQGMLPALCRHIVDMDANGCFRTVFLPRPPYLGTESFTGEATEQIPT